MLSSAPSRGLHALLMIISFSAFVGSLLGTTITLTALLLLIIWSNRELISVASELLLKLPSNVEPALSEASKSPLGDFLSEASKSPLEDHLIQQPQNTSFSNRTPSFSSPLSNHSPSLSTPTSHDFSTATVQERKRQLPPTYQAPLQKSQRGDFVASLNSQNYTPEESSFNLGLTTSLLNRIYSTLPSYIPSFTSPTSTAQSSPPEPNITTTNPHPQLHPHSQPAAKRRTRTRTRAHLQ